MSFIKKLPRNWLSLKKSGGPLIKVALSLFFFSIAAHDSASLRESLETHLQSLNFWFIAVGLHVIITALTAWRWRWIQNQVEPSFSSASYPFFQVSWASQFTGLFLFGILGTDATRAYSLRRWGLPAKSIAEIILRDRLASIFGLLFLLSVGFAGSQLSPEYWWPLFTAGLLISAFHPVFFLSYTSQALKVLMIGALAGWPWISMLGPSWSRIGLGLFTEILPLSWEGFGLGHWTFASLFSQEGGAGLYNNYFAAKIFFKLMGVAPLILLVWRPPRARIKSAAKAVSSRLPLLFAVRTQIQKDDTPDRATQFQRRLSHQNIFARGLYFILLKSPRPLKTGAALLYATAVSASFFRARPRQPLAVVRFKNEQSAVQARASLLEEFGTCVWEWRVSAASVLYSWGYFALRIFRFPRQSLRIARFFARLARRYPLYVAWRAGESFLISLYLQERWRKHPPRFVVVATEGNPHGLGAMAAAEAVSVPVLFISHGAISLNPVSLRCRWALVFGARAQMDFSGGSSRVETFIHEGFKDRWNPPAVHNRPRILIALGHAPHLPAVQELIEQNAGAEVLVRPHPHSQTPPTHIARALRGSSWRLSQGSSLVEDLRDVRCAYAGNSTVHLEILLAGIPSVYAENLDEQRERLLTFLNENLIYRGLGPFDLGAFYARPEWQERFAEYLNIQKSSAETQEELRRHLRAEGHP